jgi:hypothetical protein
MKVRDLIGKLLQGVVTSGLLVFGLSIFLSKQEISLAGYEKNIKIIPAQTNTNWQNIISENYYFDPSDYKAINSCIYKCIKKNIYKNNTIGKNDTIIFNLNNDNKIVKITFLSNGKNIRLVIEPYLCCRKMLLRYRITSKELIDSTKLNLNFTSDIPSTKPKDGNKSISNTIDLMNINFIIVGKKNCLNKILKQHYNFIDRKLIMNRMMKRGINTRIIKENDKYGYLLNQNRPIVFSYIKSPNNQKCESWYILFKNSKNKLQDTLLSNGFLPSQINISNNSIQLTSTKQSNSLKDSTIINIQDTIEINSVETYEIGKKGSLIKILKSITTYDDYHSLLNSMINNKVNIDNINKCDEYGYLVSNDKLKSFIFRHFDWKDKIKGETWYIYYIDNKYIFDTLLCRNCIPIKLIPSLNKVITKELDQIEISTTNKNTESNILKLQYVKNGMNLDMILVRHCKKTLSSIKASMKKWGVEKNQIDIDDQYGYLKNDYGETIIFIFHHNNSANSFVWYLKQNGASIDTLLSYDNSMQNILNWISFKGE